LHVTIEETDEGTLICLHLAPSETLPDPESFARQLRPSLAGPPEVPSRQPLTGLRLAPPVPLADLPVAGVSRPQLRGLTEDRRVRQVRDAFLDDLEQSVANQKPALLGLVGKLSNFVGPLLPFEGESVSQQFALAGGVSNAEIHIRMGVPFFGAPTGGRQMVEVIARDFQREALRGNVVELERSLLAIGELRETVREGLQVARNPILSSFAPGVTSKSLPELRRADTNLSSLEKAAQTSLKKAQRVRRGN